MKYPHHVKSLVFAKEQGYIITPLGWEKYISQYLKLNHCPCDVHRPECPCPEAVQEVNEIGHCKCSLYWRSYDTYLVQCYSDEWPGPCYQEQPKPR